MPRKAPIFLIASAMLALAACGGQPDSRVKNLVVVCIDTVRFDTFFLPERAGIEDPLSRRLDDAVVYTKAHAAGPWTVPSVVSFFTGLYPAQHGAGRFSEPVANLNEEVPSKLAASIPTMAERLKQAGFHTGAFTAHPWFRSGYGMERGFDELHLRKGTDKVTETGLKWLDLDKVEPFFLYLHWMEAHDRHLRTEQFDELLGRASPEVLAAARGQAPGGICDDPDSHECRQYQVYASKVMDERAALARLLGELEQRGRLADTAVLVYSDHGEAFYDHLETETALDVDPRDVFGFGHGQSLYQEMLHVPLVAWHPDLPGQTVGELTSLVDVLPTLLSWAGVEAPADELAGQVVSGEAGGASPFRWSEYDSARWPESDRQVFASGIAYGPEQMAVIEDGWKYVWHESDGHADLFNLRDDPDESEPVDNPDVIASLEPAMDRYFEWHANRDFAAPDLSDEQVEQLKGVGYLQGRESSGDEPEEGVGEGNDE